MNAADLESAVTAALHTLGTTPAAIAATLTARGITGAPGECGACPIANALAAALPGMVFIGGGYTLGVRAEQVTLQLDLPDGHVEFVDAFDRGGFPRLITPALLAVPA